MSGALLTPEELARIRAEDKRRMRMAAVYVTVGGGEDVLTIHSLLAHLDAITAAVEAMPGMNGRHDAIGGSLEVRRSDVLAILQGRDPA